MPVCSSSVGCHELRLHARLNWLLSKGSVRLHLLLRWSSNSMRLELRLGLANLLLRSSCHLGKGRLLLRYSGLRLKLELGLERTSLLLRHSCRPIRFCHWYSLSTDHLLLRLRQWLALQLLGHSRRLRNLPDGHSLRAHELPERLPGGDRRCHWNRSLQQIICGRVVLGACITARSFVSGEVRESITQESVQDDKSDILVTRKKRTLTSVLPISATAATTARHIRTVPAREVGGGSLALTRCILDDDSQNRSVTIRVLFLHIRLHHDAVWEARQNAH